MVKPGLWNACSQAVECSKNLAGVCRAELSATKEAVAQGEPPTYRAGYLQDEAVPEGVGQNPGPSSKALTSWLHRSSNSTESRVPPGAEAPISVSLKHGSTQRSSFFIAVH